MVARCHSLTRVVSKIDLSAGELVIIIFRSQRQPYPIASRPFPAARNLFLRTQQDRTARDAPPETSDTYFEVSTGATKASARE